VKYRFIDTDKIESWKYLLAVDIPRIKLSKGSIITSELKTKLLKNGIFNLPVVINQAAESSVIDEKIIDDSFEKFSKVWKNINKNKLESPIIEEMSLNIVENIMSNYSNVMYIPLKKLKDVDEYTYAHSINVSIVSTLICVSYGYDKKFISKVNLSGILHDIGKSKVPDSILNAPRKLGEDEWEIMKKHVEYGEKICYENNIGDNFIIEGVLYHHERYDGNGYAYGLSGDNIPKIARIITIADIFDALTSKRVYKDSWNYYKVISHIVQNTKKIFDPDYVQNFISVFGLYPVGTKVRLNDYRIGTVIACRKGNEMQPVVQIDDKVVDLYNEKLFVNSVIDEGEFNYEKNVN